MFLPFGDKAKQSIKKTGFLTVWEGSVRSMKTVTSLFAFLLYVMESEENTFIMTGATQGALHRNCIAGDFGIVALSAGSLQEKTDGNGNKILKLKGTRKEIYYFGGDNMSSYKPIRGNTYGGWYADEVNLQHKNTIVECFNRTIASNDRRNFWVMNPDVPDHWIYTDYIDKYQKDKLPGFQYHHFTLEDNPAIPDGRRQEIANQYTGVFYQRFILGLRVRAEGAIYVSFSDANIISEPEKVIEIIKKIQFVEIGGDIGGSSSATVYNAVGYWYEKGKGLCAAVVEEKYDKANLSTESILANFVNFCNMLKTQYPHAVFSTAYIDSAEQLIIKSMRRKNTCNIVGARKKPIIDRIRLEDSLFSQERLYIVKKCKHTINAFRSAVWNDKAHDEERLDNGTTNIDSLDATEYSLERHITDFIGR